MSIGFSCAWRQGGLLVNRPSHSPSSDPSGPLLIYIYSFIGGSLDMNIHNKKEAINIKDKRKEFRALRTKPFR